MYKLKIKKQQQSWGCVAKCLKSSSKKTGNFSLIVYFQTDLQLISLNN